MPNPNSNRYLILDSKGIPVGHGVSNDRPDIPIWRLKVDRSDLRKIHGLTHVSLVGAAEYCVAVEGQVIKWKDDVVYLQMVRELGRELRENLRIPARFQSFLYPVDSSFQGRLPIYGYDLSCGGVSFFCGSILHDGVRAQIVIPVTSQPLLLQIEILRRRSSPEQVPLYAAKFLDLLREEESMVREAIFNLQFHHASS